MTVLLRPAVTLFALLTLMTGVIYPLSVTIVAQLAFPDAADGSIVTVNGKRVGSALIGQQFTAPRYFWSRPSATSPYPYNAASSSGANLGPLNSTLVDAVKEQVAALRAADPRATPRVPVDLVTSSASGLDPDISLAAANYQAARVAETRNLSVGRVEALIGRHVKRPWLGILGEPRVNVLELNIALDKM